MIAFGDWVDLLSYNLRIAGALWGAWSGGASTVINERFVLIAAGVEFVDDFSAFTILMEKRRDETKLEGPQLKLVP